MIADQMYECIFKQCETIINNKRLFISIDKENCDEGNAIFTYFIKGDTYDEWTFIDDVYTLANELAKRYRTADIRLKTTQIPDGDEYSEWYSANIIIEVLKK